jgi:hypothetical protein
LEYFRAVALQREQIVLQAQSDPATNAHHGHASTSTKRDVQFGNLPNSSPSDVTSLSGAVQAMNDVATTPSHHNSRHHFSSGGATGHVVPAVARMQIKPGIDQSVSSSHRKTVRLPSGLHSRLPAGHGVPGQQLLGTRNTITSARQEKNGRPLGLHVQKGFASNMTPSTARLPQSNINNYMGQSFGLPAPPYLPGAHMPVQSLPLFTTESLSTQAEVQYSKSNARTHGSNSFAGACG